MNESKSQAWTVGVILAAMPALSFALQAFFSWRENTLPSLFSHLTISYIDWIFVPFNLFVVHAINWRRGYALFVIMSLSLLLNIITHAYWQHAMLENAGHMFNQSSVVLSAGWVHLCYATIQMTLIGAFLFAREPSPRFSLLLTILCCVYFVTSGISGYYMNNGLMITDVIMVSMGLAFALIYPLFAYGNGVASLSTQT